MDNDRCPVCGSPLYVISSTPTEIKLGCRNNRYPGNDNQPCQRYVDPANINPDLVTVKAVV